MQVLLRLVWTSLNERGLDREQPFPGPASSKEGAATRTTLELECEMLIVEGFLASTSRFKLG